MRSKRAEQKIAQSSPRRAQKLEASFLEFQFVEQLQKPKQSRAVLRGQLLPDLLIGGYPGLDQPFPVPVSFARQPNVHCPARFCLALRHQSFRNHGLDGAMHDGAVETQKRGDLILVERRAAAECGQDEGARRRAMSFSFQPLADRKISRRQLREYGIFQEVFRNFFSWNDVHKTVTVASSGLRHWGGSR